MIRTRATAATISSLFALAIIVGLISSLGSDATPDAAATVSVDDATSPGATNAGQQAAYGKLPVSFVPNAGQLDPEVKYHVRGVGYSAFFTPSEVVFSFLANSQNADNTSNISYLPSTGLERGRFAVALEFLGNASPVALEGTYQSAEKVNYLIGNDRGKWIKGLETYKQINYRDLWPGTDMLFKESDGYLRYEFMVHPGAKVENILLGYRGADSMSISQDGSLIIETPIGIFTNRTPVSYQEIDGSVVLVPSKFTLREEPDGHRSFGFEIGEGYNPNYPLIIDPDLQYSTYLGGNGEDVAFSIAVDSSGNSYVTGQADSTLFPTSSGAFQVTDQGGRDAFVVKLDSEGSRVYSTYLGGGFEDIGRGVAVDSSGNAYVTGQTVSADFPTTSGSYDTTFNVQRDVFITKLSSDGSSLVYSTYVGGNGLDIGYNIAVDGSGNAYVAGETFLPVPGNTFPVTNGALGGGTDAFVAKFSGDGSTLVYSTGLGGTASDAALSIDVLAGNAYVTGQTASASFPVTSGTKSGGTDAFVAKLNASGATDYAIFIGGSSTDIGRGIAVDPSGNAYLTGETASADFPVTSGTIGGGTDLFIAKIGATGATSAARFLGGSNTEIGRGIAVDDSGNAYVTGNTLSTNFPTQSPLQSSSGGNSDAFVAQLDSSLAGLVYSTYLGGSGEDTAHGVATDPNGSVYITGSTLSTNFPTKTPFQDSNAGARDIFVAKLGGTPPLITPVITGTLGDNGWYVSDVTLSWTVEDPESPISTSSGCDTSVVNSDTAGTTFTCVAKSADGTSSKSVTIKRDITPPSVSGSRSPGPNANGWNNTDVVVSFTCADALSGLLTCPSPITRTAQGAGQTASGTARDTAGNEAPVTVSEINIDKTFPTIISSKSPGPNANGWNNSDVTVSFTCADALSLIDNCTPAVTLSSDGAGQIAAGTATDKAGNQVTITATNINIDKSPPTISITSPANGSEHLQGSLLLANWLATDTMSGIASASGTVPSGSLIDTGALGERAFTVTASDLAGNSASLTHNYVLTLLPSDITPPVITALVAGTQGNNGWYVSNVEVSWTIADSESSFTTSGCESQSLASDSSGITFTCSATSAGGTSTSSVTIKRDTAPPTVDLVRTPGANANGWNNTNVEVTVDCADSTSGVATCVGSTIVTTEGSNQAVSASATDEAGNLSSALLGGISIDKTAPSVTATKSPIANSNGWNNTDVIVAASGTDSLSGIAACGSTSVTAEGPGQSQTVSCTDKAGNVGSATATSINIDKTAPIITASQSPASNASGWNNTNVTVSFSCSDVLSEISACSGPATLTENGSNQGATGSATDRAGNIATKTVAGINIDKSPPSTTIVGPAPGGHFVVGSVVLANWSTSDDLSGISSLDASTPSGSPIDTASLGTHSFTVTATDKAGNTTMLTHSYVIDPILMQIDIKPNSESEDDGNPVNVRSNKTVRVAILSSADFDAAILINRTSLTFGRTGDESSLIYRKGANSSVPDCYVKDENSDGLADLICKFNTDAAAFQDGDTEGILKGKMADDRPFEGKDVIRTGGRGQN